MPFLGFVVQTAVVLAGNLQVLACKKQQQQQQYMSLLEMMPGIRKK